MYKPAQNLVKQIICCIACMSFVSTYLCSGQQSPQTTLRISNIVLEGLKKTKPKIVLRELTVSVGDSISIQEVSQLLEQNKSNLLNTGLFNTAAVNLKNWNLDEHTVDVHISVQESWYIYALPSFELADRNFNVWWNEFNRSFDRVNVGLQLDYLNFTGNDDPVKINVQFGYAQKYDISYLTPYIDKQQTLRIKARLFHTKNKELAIATRENKPHFINDDEFLLSTYLAETELNYRPNIFWSHTLRFSFDYNQVSPWVVQNLRSTFFQSESYSQKSLAMDYELTYDRRDLRAYALSGMIGEISVRKSGFGIFNDLDFYQFSLKLNQFIPISSKWFLEAYGKGSVTLSNKKLPYYNRRALGYDENIVNGYQPYVMDGSHYFLGRAKVKYALINDQFNLGKWIPISAFQTLPIQMYLTSFTSTGYSWNYHNTEHDIDNSLVNQQLLGYGFGMDIVMYNQFVWQLEYAWNHLGHGGFFVSYNVGF